MKLDVLLEAIDYNQMFDKKFIDLVEIVFNIHGSSEIKKQIQRAKSELKRNDRIVWWLRIVKLTILAQADIGIPLVNVFAKTSSNTDLQAKTEDYLAYINAEFAKYNAKTKGNKILKKWWFETASRSLISPFRVEPSPSTFQEMIEGFHRPLNRIIMDLVHFLSLPIPKIQNYVFGWQTWEEVHEAFKEFEIEWKEARQGLIPMRDTDKVFLDVGDGYSWIDLQKTGCKEEGDAMGHCGNVPMGNKPDITILSLRKKVMDGGETNWKPSLTFIFNQKTGMLGETKGKGNDKPSAKFHKYIIQLLNDKRIKGIDGGGYLPGHNFEITDLPEATWKAMVKKKPALLSDLEYLKNVSCTDARAISIVKKMNYGLNSDGSRITVEEYNNLGDFIKHNSSSNDEHWRAASYAMDILVGNNTMDIDYPRKHAMDDMKRNLLSKAQVDALDQLEDEQPDKYDDIETELYSLYLNALESGAAGQMWEIMSKAVKESLLDHGDESDYELEFTDKYLLDSKVNVVFPMNKLSDFIKNTEITDIDDLSFQLKPGTLILQYDEPYHGYDKFDSESFNEELPRIMREIE